MTLRVTIKGLIAGAVVVASMAGTASAAQRPDQLIGSWTIQGGTTEDGTSVQIRIERIDDRGRATGTYCATRPDGSIFGFELRPKGGVKTSLKKGVLKFSRSKRKYALSMNEDGTMLFEYSRKGKKSPTMTLERNEAAGCLERFASVGERVSHEVSEDEETELVGVWAGKTNKRNLKLEIHLAQVGASGQATGLYCWTRKDRSIVAFDVGPGAPTQTAIEDRTLKAPRGNVSYDVRPKGEDRLEFTFRKEGRKQLEAKLKRSEAKGCLTHIRMLDAASGG